MTTPLSSDRASDAEFIAHAREDVPALLAEVERLREQRAALIKLHEWDELIFGGFICTHCTPDDCNDPDDNVYWPCPSLRAAAMSDDEANAIIRAHYEAQRAALLAGSLA